jgi:hypothetical protein
MSSVFISYSRDSVAQEKRVLHLAQRLRSNGLSVILDQDLSASEPEEGWSRWSERMVKQAQHVVVVCTREYRERFEVSVPKANGPGAVFEAATIRQIARQSSRSNQRIECVVFSPEDRAHVPMELRRYPSYLVEQEYDNLREQLAHPPQQSAPLSDRLRDYRQRDPTFEAAIAAVAGAEAKASDPLEGEIIEHARSVTAREQSRKLLAGG